MNLKAIKIFTLIIILAGVQTAFAQYIDRVVQVEPENITVLHNNGEFITGATTESGVEAPEGTVWSENSHDTDNLTESNTILGYGATFPQVRLADNFTIPEGETWIISSVSVWGFFSGWSAPQSPFSGGVLQIWNGVPGEEGSTVIFGDLTTDRLISSTDSNVYTINNTVAPSPGVTPNTTRKLWENKLSVAPSLTLGPGTYWIDFATTIYGNSGQFYRNVVTPGSRTQKGWDARAYTSATDTWIAITDNGRPSSAPDVPQDIAFNVNGTVASANNASKFADYDGDGKTDFGVLRWGATPSSPTEWYILNNDGSGTNSQYSAFGLRVGTNRVFNGPFLIDTVLPEDYDGDGKTDIAVFRAGTSNAEPQSTYYIINSSDNTIRIEEFGLRNDNASIMGDYDGDDIADLAIYRNGAGTGEQSTFWIKKSTTDEVISVPFGIRSDRPVVGDFDGDGKMDFSVARVSQATGESTFYTLRSGDGSVETRPIPFPSTFIVPGDYDGDGKTDFASIKSSLNNMVWIIVRSSDGITEEIKAGNYSTDFPVQGDYNGDGKTDIAVWREVPTDGNAPAYFWVRQDDGSFSVTQWGIGADHTIASIRAY